MATLNKAIYKQVTSITNNLLKSRKAPEKEKKKLNDKSLQKYLKQN